MNEASLSASPAPPGPAARASRRVAGVWAASFLTSTVGCGEAPCVLPPPALSMTPTRARALEPGLEEGLALSTSLDLGPCPEDETPEERCRAGVLCGLVRRSMRVLVVPVRGSIPVDPRCPAGFSVADLAARALGAGFSSEAGEWVLSAPPGLYLVAVARADAECARCGPGRAADVCRLEVAPRQIATLDIVL